MCYLHPGYECLINFNAVFYRVLRPREINVTEVRNFMAEMIQEGRPADSHSSTLFS